MLEPQCRLKVYKPSGFINVIFILCASPPEICEPCFQLGVIERFKEQVLETGGIALQSCSTDFLLYLQFKSLIADVLLIW